MREAAFLRRNADKWKQFESLLKNRRNVDPDQFAELYVQVTDDLSFARTFYPESRTTTYLNALALEIHGAIYRNKREHSGRILAFWKVELPMLFFRYRRELLYSFIVFALSMAIGAVSALNDESFVRTIMGDTYVNMTLENIRMGDPMAVYKRDGEWDMFVFITLNNIGVSFNVFAHGVLFSVGTIYRLFLNGVMLGAFEAFLLRHGVFEQSLLSIWLHGTIEIASIVIAGCAGLVLGNSFLFPGTYTRMESFRRGARDSIKIIVGLVPFFVVAGFIESFVTRYTDMPVALSVAIIALSFAFIVGYVVIYPHRLVRGQ
jgi:uncharacterized membrane protein SpoIIM required for sporulation